ncbi:MAG: hypothetical protein NVV59_19085 [Chitinophagaceae bacterium]|nr:hypothetical protein [Chitinophagaceae bacterium]
MHQKTEIRFPPLEVIRETYQALYNYLQVPAGGGIGEYFRFEIRDFVQKFKLEPIQTLHAVQALEQDGWLTVNEQVFAPSKLSFNCTKAFLYQFESDHPALEPLIKTLLRAYEGIFDQTCFISESTLAYLLRQDEDKVKSDLIRLHQSRLVNYEPRSDDPQVYLHRSRVPANEMHFKMDAYLERKERFRLRIAKMIEYTEEKLICRSQVTASYFWR